MSLQPSKHRSIECQGPAAGAKPSNSPHPFRGARRDGIVRESSELDGPRPRRRPAPQKHHKIEEKTSLQKNIFFLKNKMRVFCLIL